MTPQTQVLKVLKALLMVRGPSSPGCLLLYSMDIDKLMESSPSEVKDAAEAKALLEKNLLVILGKEFTIDALQAILWHISQGAKMLAMLKSLIQAIALLLGEIDEDLKVESIAGRVSEMLLDKLSPDINQLAYMSESLKASTSSVEKSVDSLSVLPTCMDLDLEPLRKLKEDLENLQKKYAEENKALLDSLQDATQKLDAVAK